MNIQMQSFKTTYFLIVLLNSNNIALIIISINNIIYVTDTCDFITVTIHFTYLVTIQRANERMQILTLKLIMTSYRIKYESIFGYCLLQKRSNHDLTKQGYI